MVDCSSALTSPILTLTQKRTPTPCPGYRRLWTCLVGAGHLSCLDLKLGCWQIKLEEALKQYTTFTVGNLGFLEWDHMPFGLCNVPMTFQRLMQNCLCELNLIYCLIYLNDLIVFLWTTEEHLHRQCIVFDQLREYNLKLKLSKCSLFKEEINYLAHRVSKQGVWPSDVNLKAIAECALTQTYMEIRAFLGLIGHYRQFIKGSTWIAQPFNNTWPEREPVESQNGYCCQRTPWKPFRLWNRPVWAPPS